MLQCTGLSSFALTSLWQSETLTTCINNSPIAQVRLRVDFGKDVGQNFGSLFEVTDEKGQAVMGAGFMGAYNTYYRSERHAVQFFIRSQKEHRLERLPRPSDNCGVYLFDLGGQLWADSRGYESVAKFWDDAQRGWGVNPSPQPPGMSLGTHRLEFFSSRVMCDGRPIFELDASKGRSGSYYYANGFLFIWVMEPDANTRRTKLYACAWDADSTRTVDLASGHLLPLSTPGEFPYSYGQLGKSVLVGTNTGGIYQFEGQTWRTLREPNLKVSFQLYAMLNYYDKLLMGQYPSGELFEFDGKEVRQLNGFPPRPPEVSPRAREAQTLALYRGDLFVGIWPWGEVWRYDRHHSRWQFIGRMFTQPPMTADVTEPYAKEMTTLDPKLVYNLWGQRVTSLVPFGDALYVGTSNKGATPYEDRFTFLSDGRWREYGSVWKLKMDAQASAQMRWTGKPTTLEFVLFKDRMSIYQDDKLLGSTALGSDVLDGIALKKVTWGKGAFGHCVGDIQKSEAALPRH
jgi:hypothetical protein